ncbi:MAG TPA: DUF4911 domain-containing protein [Geobacteraceae bacterium]|nr:DUF4911 domain-containing protein [Geobacteraceae bacterium]
MQASYKKFFRVDRRELAYLKFIIEAYDGLAVLSTVEREGAVVSVTSPSCQAAELNLLLEALSREIVMIETEPPNSASAAQRGECHA